MTKKANNQRMSERVSRMEANSILIIRRGPPGGPACAHRLFVGGAGGAPMTGGALVSVGLAGELSLDERNMWKGIKSILGTSNRGSVLGSLSVPVTLYSNSLDRGERMVLNTGPTSQVSRSSSASTMASTLPSNSTVPRYCMRMAGERISRLSERMTLLVMSKAPDPRLARLLPRPGEILSNMGEKTPKMGMSQIKPSRRSTWPRPDQLFRSRVFAWSMSRWPLNWPSRWFELEDRSATRVCKLASVKIVLNE